MTFGEYEFEYIDPDQPETTPAKPHPDPSDAAWLYFKCRDFSSRRFALATARDSRYESLKWHGLEHSNGRATIWTPSGQLIGNYRSIDTARQRLAKARLNLYLVWLEPKPPLRGPAISAHMSAKQELRNNAPQQWFMTIGFTAFGPHGARIIALDIAHALDNLLPGFKREDVAIAREDDPSVVSAIFCDRNENCYKTPEHDPPCADNDGTWLDRPTKDDSA